MPNANMVVVMGNCTRQPEIRYLAKGTAVTEIGIAINSYYKSESGEKCEKTTFVDVTLWGRQAEIAAEYLKKGHPVYIQGRLELDQWEDKASGVKKQRLKVVGETIQLLARKGEGATNNEEHRQEEPQHEPEPEQTKREYRLPPRTTAKNLEPDLLGADDDIPF